MIWDQLVYLRTSLYLLREVAKFPIRQFLPFDEQWFFTVVGRALYEAVVLGVTKLVTDQKGDLLTLRRWRNRVRELLLPEHVKKFQESLSATRLDGEVEILAERARSFRDAHVAHLRLAEVRKTVMESPVLEELDRLVEQTERLFQPLLFGAEGAYLPPVYDARVRAANEPRLTDVEKILNFMAEQSYALNEPETHPESWMRRRANMTPDELTTFNMWRVRTGKPDA